MSNTPYLFIGSSTEGLRVARVIKNLLQAEDGPPVDVELWSTAFKPGDTYIETLEREIEGADFAVLLLTDDDEIASRSKRSKAPRDNVVFELGLFIGRVGRQRCYLVHDKNIKLKLPSDLLGVETASYAGGAKRGLRAALAEPCARIRERIAELKVRRNKVPQPGLAKWEAACQFARDIEGYWWSLREWTTKTVGHVEFRIDRADSMPRVTGHVYQRNGKQVAKWESKACCVLANERKLYYYFTGYRNETRKRRQAQYAGFTEYAFAGKRKRPSSGTGVFSDRNLAEALSLEPKSLKLRRCTTKETKIMETNDRQRISALISDLLTR